LFVAAATLVRAHGHGVPFVSTEVCFYQSSYSTCCAYVTFPTPCMLHDQYILTQLLFGKQKNVWLYLSVYITARFQVCRVVRQRCFAVHIGK